MVLFCGEAYLLDINFKLKSNKTAHFMKIDLAVCRLVRHIKKIKGKREKMFLQVPDIKENSANDL